MFWGAADSKYQCGKHIRAFFHTQNHSGDVTDVIGNPESVPAARPPPQTYPKQPLWPPSGAQKVEIRFLLDLKIRCRGTQRPHNPEHEVSVQQTHQRFLEA